MKTRRIIICLFFAVPLLTLIFVIISKRGPHRATFWEESGRVLPSKITLKTWASAKFVPIGRGEEFKKEIATAKIVVTNCNPSTQQLEVFREKVYDFLVAFNAGTYEAYEKYRFPVTNGFFDTSIMTWRMNHLKEIGLKGQQLSIADAKNIDRVWWEFWNTSDNKRTGPEANHFNTSSLKEVSLDSAVFFFDETTKQLPQLNQFVTSFPNAGYFEQSPAFHFDPSPEQVLKDSGRLQFATLSCTIKNPADPPYPVYIRYYWVDKYATWVPVALGIPYSPEREYGFIF
jgi:hypothetical protein